MQMQLLKLFKQSFVKTVFRTISTNIYPLSNRSLIKLEGQDVSQFLQSIITNDMRCLEKTCKALSAFILNIQGRILYDVIIYSSTGTKSYYLECDSNVVNDLSNMLQKYKVRKNVVISIEKNLNVFHSDRNIDCFLQVNDPRVNIFGNRILSCDLKPTKTLNDYKILRLKIGLPEGPKDLPIGKCFPLESNGVFTHSIAFDKGCYIGQELTARTHHTGATRKRIMPLALSEEINIETAIICTEESKIVGMLRDHISLYGMGLLRVRESMNAKELYIKENIDSHTLCIAKPIIPTWWPIQIDERLRQLIGLPLLPIT